VRAWPGLRIGSIRMAQTAYSKPHGRGTSDDIVLTIQERGRMASSGHDVHLQPGDAVLRWSAQDTNGKFSAQFEGRATLIRVPAASIAPLVGDIGASMSRRIPAETDALRLLRPYASTLMERPISPALQQLTTRHVCDLIAMLCGVSHDGAEVARDRGGRAARLRAIKDDIAQNLAHGDISLAAIAARHRVSPRYVQKLFDSEGTTFSEHVLDQRLAHAHRLLTDPRRAGEKVATIAYAAGFGDLSYFYRAFRRRYDVLPTDLRAAARQAN
jgi:AraC-like DNA-binding protein